jgi:H+-transporting ATPase
MRWQTGLAAPTCKKKGLLKKLFGTLACTSSVLLLCSRSITGQQHQERQSEEATLVFSCLCLRGGETIRLEARELVPGDVVMLRLGDVVPADCYLLNTLSSSSGLHVDQCTLTGESLPVVHWPADTVYGGTSGNSNLSPPEHASWRN